MTVSVAVPKSLLALVAIAAICALAAAPSSMGRSHLVGIVTIQKFGVGGVKSIGSKAILCGTRCRAVLEQGTRVVLVASPASRFDYWGSHGDDPLEPCSGSGTRCEIFVAKNTRVKAHFSSTSTVPEGHEQLITVAGRGVVRSDGSTAIQCGSMPEAGPCGTVLTRGVVTLRATPAPDSIFIKWSGVVGCGTVPVCRINVGAPHTNIGATFRLRSVPDGMSRVRVDIDPTQGSVRFGSHVCPSTCSAFFPNKSLVTVTAEQGFFSDWSESCVGRAPTCILAISGSELVQATFQTYSLRRGAVRVTRSGQGRVRSAPEGIDCGNLCSATFDKGRSVTLKATLPDERYSVSWPGENEKCVALTCSVTALEGGKDVTVRFALATDELKVTKAGDGSGRVESTPDGIDCGRTCSDRFTRGTLVTLKAEEDPGSRFVGWSGACSGAGTCPVVVGQSPGRITAVTARFDLVRDEVRVEKVGDGGGTVRSTPSGITCGATCAAVFPRFSRVELRATADGTSRFAGWSGPCTGTGVCTISRLEGARRVTARFERPRDKVRVVKTGQGHGTVTSSPAGITCGQHCSASFQRGTEVVLKASPNAGSRFAGWNAACHGSGDCRLTIREPVEAHARFAPICAAATAAITATQVATKPRRVLVTIRLDGKASARLRLFHAGRKVKEKNVTGIARGSRTLRVDLPRTAPGGSYRLAVRVKDACGGTRTLERTITIPRRA